MKCGDTLRGVYADEPASLAAFRGMLQHRDLQIEHFESELRQMCPSALPAAYTAAEINALAGAGGTQDKDPGVFAPQEHEGLCQQSCNAAADLLPSISACAADAAAAAAAIVEAHLGSQSPDAREFLAALECAGDAEAAAEAGEPPAGSPGGEEQSLASVQPLQPATAVAACDVDAAWQSALSPVAGHHGQRNALGEPGAGRVDAATVERQLQLEQAAEQAAIREQEACRRTLLLQV